MFRNQIRERAARQAAMDRIRRRELFSNVDNPNLNPAK